MVQFIFGAIVGAILSAGIFIWSYPDGLWGIAACALIMGLLAGWKRDRFWVALKVNPLYRWW